MGLSVKHSATVRAHMASEVAPASGVPTLRSASGLALPTFGRMSAVAFAASAERSAAAAHAQNLYQASMAYIAVADTGAMLYATPAAIKTRLAALDQVTQIAGAALQDAPYDSVINTLYLNAQGQREASMRMLNTASTRLTTY